MKNRNSQKPGYKALERKVYLRIVLLVAVAIAVVFLVFLILSSNAIGDFIVTSLQYDFGWPQDAAFHFYWGMRPYLIIIMIAAMAVCFAIMARFLMSQFGKYFNEISGGLDVITGDKGGEIELSIEMATMERKLKNIKQKLEEREREARQAEQRKNEMVMYLAHDLKTPLTSVIGYLSLLDEVPEMPPEQRAKYVGITLEKAYRLEKLVDEFFEIARYNFQTKTPVKENIDLFYMLTQMIDEFLPLLSEKGMEAGLNVPEDLTVHGDPDKLARVFNNILKNAVAYSPDGSTIEISAGVTGDTVLICFKNEGRIPEDKLSSIFDKFYRLDSARSTDSGGAGLGLAIAKEIVLQHDGRIYAKSGDDHTSFVVELPVFADLP